jgi:aspartyl aminopeptidase
VRPRALRGLGSIARVDARHRTVDIGCAQLSMHSIRETAGTHDVGQLIRLLRTFHDRFEALDAGLIIE